jgi:hypothetical protein
MWNDLATTWNDLIENLKRYISAVDGLIAENRQIKADLEACRDKGAEATALLEKALADLNGATPSRKQHVTPAKWADRLGIKNGSAVANDREDGGRD